MASDKQVQANQKNAQKSTGPVSAEGKRKVSENRISHGILSTRLLIQDEKQEDYDVLLDGLFSQLNPVGTLEQSLVKKIAIILWRQQRLVSAETATISLSIYPKRIASEVETGLGYSGFGGLTVEAEDLKPVGQEEVDQLNWCKAIIQEFDAVERVSPDYLKKNAPLIYSQLETDAESEELSIEDYLKSTTPLGYVNELVSWCRQEMVKLQKRIDQQPTIAALSQKAKDKLSIPWSKLDILSKYQASLDNQLYKAIKALRETQQWRLDTIDSINTDNSTISVDAS